MFESATRLWGAKLRASYIEHMRFVASIMASATPAASLGAHLPQHCSIVSFPLYHIN
jgi:hypothetical protein